MFASPTAWAALYGPTTPAPPPRPHPHAGGVGEVRELTAGAGSWVARPAVPDPSCYMVSSQPVRCFPRPPLPAVPPVYGYAGGPGASWPPYVPHGPEESYAAAAGRAPLAAATVAAAPYAAEQAFFVRDGASVTSASPPTAAYHVGAAAAAAVAAHGQHAEAGEYASRHRQQQHPLLPPPPHPAAAAAEGGAPAVDHSADFDDYAESSVAAAPAAWWPPPPPTPWRGQWSLSQPPRGPAYGRGCPEYGACDAAAPPVPRHAPLHASYDATHDGAGLGLLPPAHAWQPRGVWPGPSFPPPPPFATTREDAAAPPPPPASAPAPLQQLASPLVCSSISDGARHLNSVRHRSAASAAAFFFATSPTTGAAAEGGGADLERSSHGPSARRHARRGGADRSALPSPASDPLLSASSIAAATQADPCCVAALVFNSAKEVGVALCELPSLTVSLLQYGDTATFFKTTSLLHSRNPVEVLVPATAVDSELVGTLLRQHGSHMTFTSVQRCFYNAEEGVQRLLMLKSTPEAALYIEDTDRYLCVAAANAVVLYMEHVNDMHLLPGSVRVRAEALDHYMELSRTTARALQVIPDAASTAAQAVVVPPMPSTEALTSQPSTRDVRRGTARFTLRPGHGCADASSPPPPLRAAALVDVIPRACTVMGQRYLRRTLLQPLRDRVAVQGRHDAVEWLLREPRRLHALRTLLRQTAALDLERLTATLTHQPRRERTAAQMQSYLESLQLLWSALPHLAQLHARLDAYLGPPPSPPPQQVNRPESNAAEPGTPRDARAAAPPGSTPDQPAVLRSIAATLAHCHFEALSALMGSYLERSVLPSVVQQHEQGSRHYGALYEGEAKPPPQHRGSASPTSRRNRQRRQSGEGGVSSSSASSHSQRATASLLRLLRMCFLVQAPRGGELDALRTRLSVRVSDITAYAADLRAALQMSSLRLEPDPVKLYCLSYLAAEEAKAQAGPFTWRYAGGSHFALYLAALRERQLTQQRQRRGRGGHDGAHLISDTSANTSASSASSVLNESTEASMLHRLSRRGHGLHQHHHDHHKRPEDAASLVLSPLDAAALDAGSVSDSGVRQLRRRRVRCGTEDLEYRCARAQECVAALLQLQLQAVQPLVSTIQREYLGVLQATVESVALLDTLLSFALYSLTHQCTRPVLVELRTGVTTAPCASPESARASEAEAEALADAAASTASTRDGHCARSARAAEGCFRKAQPRLAHRRGGTRHAMHSEADSSDDSQDAAGEGRTRQREPAAAACAGASSPFLQTAPSPPTVDSPRASGSCDASASQHEDDATDTDGAPSATAAIPRCSVYVLDALHPSATSTATAAAAGAAAPSRPSAHTAPPSGGSTLSWGCDGCVCVITGPNACGKTTLLRLLGQYFTLAQAGCFVPARHARLFLADRLLAHMLCDELPSITQSSFRRELMELNEVTHAATEESVALIDELGRSTTTAQGFSLAWATALYLCERGVHAVLTTHYTGLPSLTRVRPRRVVAFHYRVAFQQREEREGVHATGVPPDAAAVPTAAGGGGGTRRRTVIVRFGHTLFPGPCPQRWYGLALAERLQFFEPVLALAQRHEWPCD